jgi:hypothetical protein
LVTACSVICSLTPTKSDDAIVAAILRVLNTVSLNVGRSKNADDK